MCADGYSSETSGVYLHAADHLGQWVARRGVAIADLDEDLLARFVRHLPRCRCRGCKRGGHTRVPFRVHAFLRYLREAGVVTTSAPEATRPPLVTEYGTWMRDRRGLAATTMARSLPVVQALLGPVGDDPTRLDAAGVRRFVLEYIRQHAPASAGWATTIVRCFLLWLVALGRCSIDLVEACDRPRPVARRDRAMLLLARLGLRAGDVVALRLGDMEWARGRLRVVGKGRRETRLPLPQDAGDAMFGYLETERPAVATDHVFLTARPPIHPIRSSGVRDVVCRAIGRAGVRAPSRGTHILRHSLATRLLRDGASLDAIGAVLRHRDVNTTARYATVDVGLLRQVAQPWPDAEGVVMLKPSIDASLALRRAVGFRLQAEEALLHDFARWAADRGDTHVRTQTATEWAAAARSLWQRERRLRAVAGFARSARAEDPRHEVPPIFVFGRRHVRPRPHIYAPDELRRLLDAASRLPGIWPLRPQVFPTLFGLLASSGVRVSEALALRFGDVTSDGLVIRKTKFNKGRLVPLHGTAAAALGRYLALRRRASTVRDYVFVSPKGGRLPSQTVSKTFLHLARHAGLRAGPGTPGQRMHDLRHTFAVRALEACPHGGSPVGWHMRALSTYLGHRNLADTCWYLHATPLLMRGVADACERFLDGGAR